LSRKIIDSVNYIGESLHSVSAKPTKLAMQWMADKVAPTYWTPNSEIIACHKCSKQFVDLLEKKHHCRGCGKGFCDKCTSKRMIIPWWSPSEKVRVCDVCFDKKVIPEPLVPNATTGQASSSSFSHIPSSYSTSALSTTASSGGGQSSSSGALKTSGSSNSLVGISGTNDVIVRKMTETVQETIGFIGYATKLPFDVLKESARPSYWRPDSECVNCAICKKEFTDLFPLHHCRSCGNGVCHGCSPHLKPVPSRGWETPVRVCNNCVSNELS
jgi:zinc finger FYVE domain-containing protein 1